MFPRPMDYRVVNPEYVDYLNLPVMGVGFSPCQLIKRLANQQVDRSLWSLFHFLMPSTGLLTLILAACLLYLASSALFLHLKRLKSLRESGRVSIKLVSLFYFLFLFFIRYLFEGNLNTSNVLVRTDELIYSKEQILNTQKEFCFLEKSKEVDFLKDVSSQFKGIL